MSDDCPTGGDRASTTTLDAEINADTPERMKALGDRLRMTVLDLVLERAMTVTELAERLKRPRGTVAYHVDVLVDAGLLQVVRTRQVRAVDERFYGRTARTIMFHQQTPGELPFFNDVLAEVDFERLEAKDTGRLRHVAPRPHPVEPRRGVRRPARRPVARVHRPAARRRLRVRPAHHAVPDHPAGRAP